MRRYILLAMLLAFAGTVGVAVAKTPTRTHTCAAVTTRFFKATNVRVNHISCVQAAGKIGGWIERGPKTMPLNAKKWHARRLGGGQWKVSFGKKGNPSVTFTLVGISSKPKPPPPPPPPPTTTTVSTPTPPPPVVDTTPPVITPHVTGTLGESGWYTSDVTVSWTVSDPESAISSSSGCDVTTITTDTSGRSVTCTATSAGGRNSQSVTVKRDTTVPVITITTPGDGTLYKPGEVVNAVYTCTDPMDSNPTCQGPTPVDSPVSTENNTPNQITDAFTVTSKDVAGNTSSKTIHYNVAGTPPPPKINGYYALTFDDGPDPTFTQPVLNALMGINLQTLVGSTTVPLHPMATFCLKGINTSPLWFANNVGPNLANQEVADGMTLCDHTWNHQALAADQPPDLNHPPVSTCTPNSPHFVLKNDTPECFANEITDGYNEILTQTKQAPQWIRPPYGYYDQSTLDGITALGAPYSNLAMLGWTTDSYDWCSVTAGGGCPKATDNPSHSVTTTVSDIVGYAEQVPKGGIILMHDGQQATVDALPTIIQEMWTKFGMLPGKLDHSGNWPGPFGWQPSYQATAVDPLTP